MSKGFTFIELLIVMVIIAALTTLGLLTGRSWSARSRDTIRMNDINQMRTAFEVYVSKYNDYSSDANCSDIFSEPAIFPDGKPTDPAPGELLELTDYHTSCTPTVDYKYCLCAELENQSGNSNGYDCTSFDTSGDESFFCVVNIN